MSKQRKGKGNMNKRHQASEERLSPEVLADAYEVEYDVAPDSESESPTRYAYDSSLRSRHHSRPVVIDPAYELAIRDSRRHNSHT